MRVPHTPDHALTWVFIIAAIVVAAIPPFLRMLEQ